MASWVCEQKGTFLKFSGASRKSLARSPGGISSHLVLRRSKSHHCLQTALPTRRNTLQRNLVFLRTSFKFRDQHRRCRRPRQSNQRRDASRPRNPCQEQKASQPRLAAHAERCASGIRMAAVNFALRSPARKSLRRSQAQAGSGCRASSGARATTARTANALPTRIDCAQQSIWFPR